MPRFKFCPMCRTELVTAARGGHPRGVCPAPDCGFVDWDNPVPVVAAIVEHDGQVVLVRSRGSPPGWFGLVAGFLEPGETPAEGVLREVAEETGIDAADPMFVGVHPFRMRNQIIFTYHVEVPHLNIRLCEDELADYRIVPIDALKPWPRGTGPALKDWLASRGHHPETVEFGRHLDA